MAGNARSSGRRQLPGSELLNDLAHNTRTPGDDADPSGGESLVGIGTAVAGENMIDSLVRHIFGRLDARTAGHGGVGVIKHLKAEVIRFNHEKTRTPPKTRVNSGV